MTSEQKLAASWPFAIVAGGKRDGNGKRVQMDISEMERSTIVHAEQLMLAWLWVFDVDTLCNWINQHCPVKVTCQQVAYVLYYEQAA